MPGSCHDTQSAAYHLARVPLEWKANPYTMTFNNSRAWQSIQKTMRLLGSINPSEAKRYMQGIQRTVDCAAVPSTKAKPHPGSCPTAPSAPLVTRYSPPCNATELGGGRGWHSTRPPIVTYVLGPKANAARPARPSPAAPTGAPPPPRSTATRLRAAGADRAVAARLQAATRGGRASAR